VGQNLVVHFDGDPVRFTPGGKVSVIDAIGALTHSECPGYLWDDVKKKHPEIMSYCDNYSFQNEQSLPVVDNKGWKYALDRPDGLSGGFRFFMSRRRHDLNLPCSGRPTVHSI